MALLEQIANGHADVIVTTPVFFEVAFVLARAERFDRGPLFDVLEALLAFDGLRIDERFMLRRTLELARAHNVPIVDAYQAAAMEGAGSSTIISFDRHFDRFPGIERVEP